MPQTTAPMSAQGTEKITSRNFTGAASALDAVERGRTRLDAAVQEPDARASAAAAAGRCWTPSDADPGLEPDAAGLTVGAGHAQGTSLGRGDAMGSRLASFAVAILDPRQAERAAWSFQELGGMSSRPALRDGSCS